MNTIDENELSECLKRPLVFGDWEQIRAIREMRNKLEEQERRSRKIANGQIKKFRVRIAYRGEETIEVWATDENSAIKIGEDLADMPDCWDIASILSYPLDSK